MLYFLIVTYVTYGFSRGVSITPMPSKQVCEAVSAQVTAGVSKCIEVKK